MSNVPSFGKSIMILLIGAAAGFAGCTTQQPAVPDQATVLDQGAVVCSNAPGVDLEIKLDVDGTQIIGVPGEVSVCVDNGDQIVWLWPGNPIQEFTVSLTCGYSWDQPNRPCEGVENHGPPNPFLKPFIPPVGGVWTSVEGKISSGPANPGARGHTYKFTVASPGLEPLDPHVRFY